ncbi:MAG: PH domain-containing protein, partial [Novosphingobium sp.]
MTQTIDSFRSSTWGWLRGSLAGWATLLLCLVGIGLVIIAVKWVQNLATTYELTEDRLILRKGIVNKSVDEIELYRVKDVRIEFSLIAQWAGIGTITLISSDETTGSAPLVIPDVENGPARREKLRELVNTARRLRGVREFDMVEGAILP